LDVALFFYKRMAHQAFVIFISLDFTGPFSLFLKTAGRRYGLRRVGGRSAGADAAKEAQQTPASGAND
jgi:hypothetical protein